MFYRKEDQKDMEADIDEEEIYNVMSDYESYFHWGIIIDDNEEGIDKEKYLLHANMWDVYIREKKILIEGGYSLEVSGSDGKKAVWDVI